MLPGASLLLCLEQSKFFSSFANELTESLARLRAGKDPTLFPAAHGLGINANPGRQLFLRPVASLTLAFQLLRKRHTLFHRSLARAFTSRRTTNRLVDNDHQSEAQGDR